MKLLSENAERPERGLVLVLFTLSLPALLGLIVLGVDLGNLFLAREKLNLLSRSAAATAINVRALRGWAPLACAEESSSLGFTCTETITQAEPQGRDYKYIVQEVNATLLSQMETLLPESVVRVNDKPYTTPLVQYGLPTTGGGVIWSESIPTDTAPIYNLKTDTFRLKLRYGVKTILLSQLGDLLRIKISGLCQQPTGQGLFQNKRCWVENSDSLSSSATTKARVIMLLDTSGSMQSKQQALTSAVASFIDYFNPYKDELGIIPYGTGVKTGSIELGLFNSKGSDKFFKIKDVVSAFDMDGQTNPCDALIESAAMIDRKRATEKAPSPTRTFVVLFTDGAPNVYRLRFCDPKSSTSACEQPAALAATTAPDKNDWYGWTVRWGRRDTYKVGDNPVYGAPKIAPVNGPTNYDFNTTPVGAKPGNFRINERGEFMVRSASGPWCNMERSSTECRSLTAIQKQDEPYHSLPLKLLFAPDPLPLADNNYLWNGPSYLVNRRDQTSMGSVTNLIDRVDPSAYPTLFTTCGPPNRKGTAATNPDQFSYNHSLYFASRVLDRNWTLTRQLFFGGAQQDVVYLTKPHPLRFNNPSNLTIPFFAGDDSSTQVPTFDSTTPPPGCLDALDAEIPVAANGVKLFVGVGRNSFWSNTDSASVGEVGEIIKSAELPYYCAIRTADHLRQDKNATVFAVGLGEGARYTYGESCWDPLQNALDFNLRKDFFLQRLALAPEALVFAPKSSNLRYASWKPQTDFNVQTRGGSDAKKSDLVCSAYHPLQDQTVTIGFTQQCNPASETAQSCSSLVRVEPGNFSQDSLGGYYPTSDPSALKSQFGAIAKQILFRLTL